MSSPRAISLRIDPASVPRRSVTITGRVTARKPWLNRPGIIIIDSCVAR